MGWGYGWRPYVPVAQRLRKAEQFAAKLAKQNGRPLEPVRIEGRKIAGTFWGVAWCENLESYSDFANRLPRGRTYVRNGSVIDLRIKAGELEAVVAGSEVYRVKIEIDRLSQAEWRRIKADCAAAIDSLMDLLAGRLSAGVMSRLTRPKDGLFPSPKAIRMSCSCPDYAVLCKHVAAVLYGVGSHLDRRPELLFLLRGVDQHDLIASAVAEGNLQSALGGPGDELAGEDLGALFGIELESSSTVKVKRAKRSTNSARRGNGKATEAASSTATAAHAAGESAKKKRTSAKTATRVQLPKPTTTKAAVAKKFNASRKMTAGKKEARVVGSQRRASKAPR